MNPHRRHDGPWKDALERFFRSFLRLLFPAVHDGIDWAHGHEFLDTELQQAVRDAAFGKRLADKLVKVRVRGGAEALLLIHVEVQGHPEREFARRMYVYNYRLFDRYDHEVVSLAVLADDRPGWRPSTFGYEHWGFRLSLEFPVVKLSDYVGQVERLRADPNPFALVVLAHLEARATQRDPWTRMRSKLGLVKTLFDRPYSGRDTLELFRFLDWVLALPDELARPCQSQVASLAKERKVPYITSLERLALRDGRAQGLSRGLSQGLSQGRREGRADAVLDVLAARFARIPRPVRQAVRGIKDAERLRRLLRRAATVDSLDTFAAALRPRSTR